MTVWYGMTKFIGAAITAVDSRSGTSRVASIRCHEGEPESR